ncbi:hypothetical protein [Streptomyces sp. NRRL F-5123]|uniref:hypothetical protein n=1 Tax=Streptomyces sp. NRRL F-5123 TaxID=1463856 RepID=UPI0004E1BAF9|nr:hypothetical protein [Streptomyces sp. NRRL F-5123]
MTSTVSPAEPPACPAPLDALLRHFTDLREGTHAGHRDRTGKDAAFRAAVRLMDAPARQVLAEFDTHLLLGSGTLSATGLRQDALGGSFAAWSLSWPEQLRAGISPLTLHAHYGAGFHHPHLRGATVAEWPLNVSTPQQAAELAPTLRAIASADLHNLVFQRDWRIVPALHQTPRAQNAGEGPPG